MIKLENKNLALAVSPQGAEIHSLINKDSGLEHIWQADPAVWPWHSPNLFPVVGALRENRIRVNDQPFSMGRHGFARNSTFSVITANSGHAVFSLSDSDATREQYPYKFEFQVIYDLLETRLRVSFKVINRQDSAIYFSLGAHPAFKVPFFEDEDFEDYYIEFSEPPPSRIHLLNPDGLFNGQTKPAPIEERKIALRHELFAHDALVMKEVKSRNLSISSFRNPWYLEVEFQEFPFLGIWSKDLGNFVCIEPWLGYADSEGPEQELAQKEAIHKLEQGHVFEACYYIGFGER